MKFAKALILSTIISIGLFTAVAKADTIITTPIDSRPISTDYLKALAEINGDIIIYSDKDNLDFFSAINENNRTGSSKDVRCELYENASKSDTPDTTVIINTSSYFTNGLIGSRSGINYTDYLRAVEDLKKLVTTFKEPNYIVNLCMPRTLPETRFNEIWTENAPPKGLAHYYLKHNPDSPNKAEIKAKAAAETPSQFLLEYGYVFNKSEELGTDKLTPWETEFMDNIEKTCLKSFPFRKYLSLYRKPFECTADIFDKLANLKKRNLIDEIVISNDDFQLPDFIIYMSGTSENGWIQSENGSPIKFSFARKYMTTGVGSIKKQIEGKFGKDEAKLALAGKSGYINMIFGLDEVPQLIYARSLSKRSGISPAIIPVTAQTGSDISKFDVLTPVALLSNDIAFLSTSPKKTAEKMYIYLYDYNKHTEETLKTTVADMKAKKENGAYIALIELYSYDTLNQGNNVLFRSLISGEYGLKLSDLSVYSAWNTNANAIGLGTAHAAVFLSASAGNRDECTLLTANTNMLTQHYLEDGIYTCNTKRILSNAKYIPTEEDLSKSEKLLTTLAPEAVLSSIKGSKITYKNKTYEISDCVLSEYSFPWRRVFECYLKIDSQVAEKS